MSNLLQTGASWLIGQLKLAAGRTVCFRRRGSPIIAELTGTCSQTMYEIADAEGLLTSVTSFDWLFETADLIHNGQPIEARPGDLLVESLNGATVTYEPLPLPGKPITEWADTSGLITMIHTKRV